MSSDTLQFPCTPCQSGQDICGDSSAAVDDSSENTESEQVDQQLEAEMSFRPEEFEVDPQTCWPCVGCQDEGVPKTMRWCSVM